MHMADQDRIKIVVAGDSGVGKTALVHLLCRQETLPNPAWTVGCSCDVKMHDYKAGTPVERPFYVEFWDVSGSACHPRSRALFYANVDGVLLVHDLSNRKSEQNLQRWLTEITDKSAEGGLESVCSGPPDAAPPCWQPPVLVVATKMDLVGSDELRRRSSLAVREGLEELQLDCTSARSLAPGITHAVAFDRFFDRVVDSRATRVKERTPPSSLSGGVARRHVPGQSMLGKVGGGWKSD